MDAVASGDWPEDTVIVRCPRRSEVPPGGGPMERSCPICGCVESSHIALPFPCRERVALGPAEAVSYLNADWAQNDEVQRAAVALVRWCRRLGREPGEIEVLSPLATRRLERQPGGRELLKILEEERLVARRSPLQASTAMRARKDAEELAGPFRAPHYSTSKEVLCEETMMAARGVLYLEDVQDFREDGLAKVVECVAFMRANAGDRAAPRVRCSLRPTWEAGLYTSRVELGMNQRSWDRAVEVLRRIES